MSVKERIKKVRSNYTLDKLSEESIPENPIALMKEWLKEALDKAMEPNAMILATMGLDGYPQERVVLLRSFSEQGLSFYTNYNSQKGQEMANNNRVSALFFWPELERQIRVKGEVSKLSSAESDAYFASRPRESQLGAWASQQSENLENRSVLDESLVAVSKKFEGKEVPRPAHWGGFIIKVNRYEFWQGGASRLHDRIIFEPLENSWTIKRLYP